MVAAVLVVGALPACTAVQRIPSTSESGRAYLELKVEPKTAELYIDGNYRGKVKGWKQGIVPVEPGKHGLKLVAEGYITQRFDATFEPGKTTTLTLEMEPRIDNFVQRKTE